MTLTVQQAETLLRVAKRAEERASELFALTGGEAHLLAREDATSGRIIATALLAQAREEQKDAPHEG